MVEPNNDEISIKRQCELLGINRSTYYYQTKQESEENMNLMEEMDKLYTARPYYGTRRISRYLQAGGYKVNIKRIRRLKRKMGLETIYCKPNLSKANKEHKKYPYLLRDVKIERPNHVWSCDITYIPMKMGFLYLTAVIDWYSRYILSWRLSNSLEGQFCVEALEEALQKGTPKIFNTDQGVQFTSEKFTQVLAKEDIKISMDGKGRALDNVFIERYWRTLKYEYVYLNTHETGKELYEGLKSYIEFYNKQRQHQSLDYKTPSEIYYVEKYNEQKKTCENDVDNVLKNKHG